MTDAAEEASITLGEAAAVIQRASSLIVMQGCFDSVLASEKQTYMDSRCRSQRLRIAAGLSQRRRDVQSLWQGPVSQRDDDGEHLCSFIPLVRA